MNPRVVAIAAHKGGVGKTTTALALAAGLVRFRQQRVLLVDLDPQGHSTMGTGLEAAAIVDSVRELFLDEPAKLGQCFYPTAIGGLELVPATIRLERVAQLLVGRPMRHVRLAQVLATSPADLDWVVIDCPPSLGPLVENALYAADEVIVPCRMEARASDGLVDLVELLEQVKPRFQQWHILRTQRDARASVTNAAVDAALEPWTDRFLETVIPRSEALNQAQIARQDIYAFDAESAGARSYAALCEEVMRWQEATTASVAV